MKLLDSITVTSILGVFTVPAECGRTLEIINRPTYALSFCNDEGVISYVQNGKRTLSDKNHAVILPMKANYTLKNEVSGNFPIINFCTSKPFTDTFLSIELRSPDIYLADFKKMKALWTIPNNRSRVFSIFYDMLHKLSGEKNTTDPILSGAMEYIMQNLGSPSLSNVDLAKTARVSEVDFRRIFKDSCGTTPKQYILNLRIEQAKRLLDEGMSSVKAIAEDCGFSSIYHFSRIFKSTVGLSPTEYVKRRY